MEEIQKICDELETLGKAYEEYEFLMIDSGRSGDFERGSLLAVLNTKYMEITQKLCALGYA